MFITADKCTVAANIAITIVLNFHGNRLLFTIHSLNRQFCWYIISFVNRKKTAVRVFLNQVIFMGINEHLKRNLENRL